MGNVLGDRYAACENSLAVAGKPRPLKFYVPDGASSRSQVIRIGVLKTKKNAPRKRGLIGESASDGRHNRGVVDRGANLRRGSDTSKVKINEVALAILSLHPEEQVPRVASLQRDILRGWGSHIFSSRWT
jgi:hypothetical protein